MAKRMIEALSGIGDIYAGEVLLRRTQYSLSLWSEAEPPAGGEGANDRVNIDGNIDITGIAEAIVLAGPNSLTLRLEDGRRLAFSLTSAYGRIVGRGRLEAG
jgi:hypothetical protein